MQKRQSIVTDRYRTILVSLRATETSTELGWWLNELIQHREPDFAMFYHKDKDKWIALVLIN